jgi:spore coat protein U-like protein
MKSRSTRVAWTGAIAAAIAVALGTADAPDAEAGNLGGAMNVGVAINIICNVSNSQTIAFGSYTGGALTGTTTFRVHCNKGIIATLYLSQGAHPGTGSTDAVPVRRMALGTGFVNYGLYQDAAFTIPWGNTLASADQIVDAIRTDRNETIYGIVPAGQTPPVGTNYTDQVVATLQF